MTIYVKDSGTWKEIKDVYTNTGGMWEQSYEVYAKDTDWKLVYPDVQVLTLFSTTDVALDTWMASAGARPGFNVKVHIPANEVIGGTVDGGYAITVGDISIYKSVTLVIDGEVQARGGHSAGYKPGSHAIHTNYPINIIVNATGAIRGGGGAGGAGGKGGDGHWVWNTGWGDNPSTGEGQNNDPWEENYQPTEGASLNASFWRVNDYSRWKNAAMGDAGTYAYNIRSNSIALNSTDWAQDSFVYTKGAYKSGGKYIMRRAPLNKLIGGAGGAGGNGKGYGNDSISGSSGSKATSTKSGAASTPNVSYGGTGGAGGAGGWWASAGTAGESGTSGTKFQAKGRASPNSAGHESGNKVTHSYVQSGSSGASPGAAGRAAKGTGAITLTNDGTINGIIENPDDGPQ